MNNLWKMEKPEPQYFYVLRSLKRAISNTLKIYGEELGGTCNYIDNVAITGICSTQFSDKSIKDFHLQYKTKMTESWDCEIFVEGTTYNYD